MDQLQKSRQKENGGSDDTRNSTDDFKTIDSDLIKEQVNSFITYFLIQRKM